MCQPFENDDLEKIEIPTYYGFDPIYNGFLMLNLETWSPLFCARDQKGPDDVTWCHQNSNE